MEGQTQAAAPAAPPAQGGPASGPIGDRMKAFLNAPADNEPAEAAAVAPQVRSKAASEPADEADARKVAPEESPVPDAQAQAEAEDQADESVDVQSDDAQSEEWHPSDLSELLSAAFGEATDKGFDLPVKVKIDGKEGTATLRDLVKSYQLDSLHHQKLETLSNERKSFEGERQKFQGERADKLLRMDAGLQTLERALYGEFASVNWQQLAAEDPNVYNAKLVGFQARNAELQDIARSIQTEKSQHQAQFEAAQQAYLVEQRELLLSKVPEWSDDTVRTRDKAEIISYLMDVGFNKQEAEGITDHRQALVVRDAWNWRKLQKSKPSVLNKVKAAPKLIRPGTQQSRASQAAVATSKDRDRLRQTGRITDAGRAIASRLKASM